jgi:RHS repeat-associated protein
LYLGGVELVIQGGLTTARRVIGGIVQQTVVGGAVQATRYLFHDHLGSVVRIADANGALAEGLDFTAFGERRSYGDPNGTGSASPTTTRGFTGHEMVDGTGVIHMNGRIYDAALGRFLQPDPLIQSPDNAQSWNAYTYVFNNPLAYTDPTGMFTFRQLVGIAIAVIGTLVAPQFGSVWAKIGYAMAIGFASGYVATGTFRGGVIGAFSAGITMGIANAGNLSAWQRVGLQATTGGVVESLSGGKFGHGFVSAGVTASVMPQVGHIGNDAARTVVGALVGGTLSKATGGKFANGAVSGAIQGAMARVQTQRQSSQAYGTGDGTEGAPEEIAVLLKDPTTRQEGLRAMARSVERGYMANDIYYKDQFYVNSDGGIEPYTGAVTQGRIITFYKPAFYWDYDALVSDLEHEVIHWHQYRQRGGAKNHVQMLERELAAYKFQVESNAFRRAPVDFQRGTIRSFQMHIDAYRQATEPPRIRICSDISKEC